MLRPITIPALILAFPATLAARAAEPPGKARGEDELTTRAVAAALLDAHNREREAEKLPPLAIDPDLAAVAQAHADDMAAHQKMSHEGSDGSTPFDRIKRRGYRYQDAGENVAEGQPSVKAVMRSWMNSPHHRENILGKFTRAGFAVATDDEGNPYWCVDFATPFPKLDPSRAAADLIGGVNKSRGSAGREPLRAAPALAEAADRVARALARADSLDTSKAPDADLGRALNEAGYRFRTVGQSAASGQPEAGDVVASWLKSDASKKVLLDDFTEAGAGYAVSESGTPYWCLILARPAAR